MSGGGAKAAPRVHHFCVTVEDFNVEQILTVLADHGVTRNDSGGPMTVRVRIRGLENGGAKEGTPELYLTDAEGIVVQLQDVSYCGGSGYLGNVCP